MSKEKYFRMQGKKEILFDKFDNTPDWLIKTKVPMYRDDFQNLVHNWGKPIEDSEDMYKFISWVNKMGIQCYVIPKIYFIENNKHKIIHSRSGSFKE